MFYPPSNFGRFNRTELVTEKQPLTFSNTVIRVNLYGRGRF